MSSSAAVIRTQGMSLMGAWSLNTQHSIFLPTAPSQAKAHIREELDINPRYNNFVPGQTVRFEITRDVDMITQIDLIMTCNPLTAASWQTPTTGISTSGTFGRRVDLFGLSCWKQLRIGSGTQRLQTLQPYEIYVHALKCYSETKRRNMLILMGQATPYERSRDNIGTQEYRCQLLTAMGFGMYGDPSMGVYIRGLNDFLTFEFDLETENNLTETDAVFSAGVTAIPTNASGFYTSACFLACEGWHLGKAERSKIAEVYKANPFSMVFNDQQYASVINIPAATTLAGTVITSTLMGITQPVTYLALYFQWVTDTTRSTSNAGGTRGRNKWNHAGWWNAGGLYSECISTVSLVTGNSNIIRTIPIRRLGNYNHARDFKGTMVPSIPAASFSYDASAVNAMLGFVSFEQIDQPQIALTFQVPQVTAGASLTTVGDISTADIGVSDALQLTVIGFTKNMIGMRRLTFVSLTNAHIHLTRSQTRPTSSFRVLTIERANKASGGATKKACTPAINLLFLCLAVCGGDTRRVRATDASRLVCTVASFQVH